MLHTPRHMLRSWCRAPGRPSLVMSGTFDTITDSAMFAAWLTYMLGAIGIYALRKKMPDAERKYRVWGYPWTPAIFIVFSGLFLINSIVSNTQNAMMGLALISLGVPVYFIRSRKGGWLVSKWRGGISPPALSQNRT